MEHDIQSGLSSSVGDELPGDPNPPDSEDTTGDARVDRVLQGLTGLGDLPVTEHPQVYERIHGALAEVLGELRPNTGPADEHRTGG